MKFIKKNGKYIGIVMVCIFCSYLTTIATSYIFESSDVRFDNTGTSLESVNVQDAIDETFHHVTDYNEIKTTIGNSTLTTTNQTLTGAVNELKTDVSSLSNKTINLSAYNTCADAYASLGNGQHGFQRINIGASDSPDSSTEWQIESFNSGSSYGWQTARRTNDNKVYYRRLFTGSWSSWESLSDQINTLNSKMTPEVLDETVVGTYNGATLYRRIFNTPAVNITGSDLKVITGLPAHNQLAMLNVMFVLTGTNPPMAEPADAYLRFYVDNAGNGYARQNISSAALAVVIRIEAYYIK